MNAKLREKGKKEEQRRLREFVDAAYRCDPRVIARREAQAAERERRKAEKAEARRLQEQEAQRLKDEAEAKRLAEEEANKLAAAEAKKAREVEKRLTKKERQRLRAIASGGAAGGSEGSGAAAAGGDSSGERLLGEDDTERLCASLDLQQLQQLADAASAPGLDAAARAAVLAAAVQQLADREREEQEAKERQKREAELALKNAAKLEHARKMAAMREWSDDELRLLDKAVKKFPMGTPKRWEQVAAYVRTRTLDEVLLMVKEHQGASNTRARAQEDWKGAAKKRADVTSAADLRCAAFTDVDVKLAGEAAETLGAGAASNGTASAAAASSASSGKSAATTAPAAKPAAAGAAAAAADDWTEAQQLALVQALKQFGKELPDRWERVAAAVPGKAKGACVRRFKELKTAFRAAKAEEAASAANGGE